MKLTARLDRAHIPPQGAELQLLIQLAAPAATGDRVPLNLAAVVDRSGSMSGAKLAYTKQALLFLVDQMAPQDRLSVITFDDQIETLLPSQPVIHKDALKAQLKRIESGGSTNLSGGLATGMQQIGPHHTEGAVSRALLLTDGQANVGVTDPTILAGWVSLWRQKGLTLSCLGVGDDFNEDLLVALAEGGGGRFHYLPNPDAIPAIFAAELQGLVQVAGQALQLQVQAEPGVAITGVIGYPPSGTPHDVTLSLPDIYAGEVKSVLLTLAVAAPPGPDDKLATVTLNFHPSPGPITANVTVGVTEDVTLLSAPPDPEVVREAGLARAAQARDEAVTLSDRGNLQEAAQRLAFAASALEPLATYGDTDAQEQLTSLRAQAQALRSSSYDKALRKQMRHDSHQAKQGRPRP